mmetsp:Transcript_25328/g.44813  ORF Transcript_25328/g.44813 Transcript_25328/m.44813 type:complete len:597 (-) Transcript_25328:52-1842(-)
MRRRGGDEQDDDAKMARRAFLKPRAVEVVEIEDDTETIAEQQERKLAELRKRALSALNLGLPPSCDESDGPVEPAAPPDSRSSGFGRCTCLRRSGRCTCNEDRAWLQSKRREVSIYQPPHARLASGGYSSISRTDRRRLDEDEHCTCLRRSGRCTCKQDDTWLQRKRRLVVPYVPPHLKERDGETLRQEAMQIEIEDEDMDDQSSSKGLAIKAASLRGSVASSSNMSLVRRAAEWDNLLEQRSESRFNPLQMDEQMVLEDTDGLVAECVDHPLSVKGVKGLPAIQSGRYQYEVELLRDSSMMLGWSGAMSLPGVLDFQSYTYSSSGCKWHGQEESTYAKPYGREGDIVGALIDWIEPETATGTSSVQISFCLNGESLGPAFNVAGNLLDAKKGAPVPLQPHICQLPKGDMLKVRLRGSKAGAPLAHPVEGYQPLSAVCDVDFCPFSVAVAAATSERVIMNMTPDHLQSFRLPENHIVELYDFPSDAGGEALTSSVACFLGLKRHFGVLHVCITEAGSSTALAACRRPEYAEKLIEASQSDETFGVVDCIDVKGKREKPLHFEARPLSSATARSKQSLRQWRGASSNAAEMRRGITN